VLNAAYFLPIIFAAWFGKETIEGGKEHGEAPFAAVLALTITAALTILFFLFNSPVIELEKQLLEALS
jgi:multicomponent Na+:H+ antiporter subunit D